MSDNILEAIPDNTKLGNVADPCPQLCADESQADLGAMVALAEASYLIHEIDGHSESVPAHQFARLDDFINYLGGQREPGEVLFQPESAVAYIQPEHREPARVELKLERDPLFTLVAVLLKSEPVPQQEFWAMLRPLASYMRDGEKVLAALKTVTIKGDGKAETVVGALGNAQYTAAGAGSDHSTLPEEIVFYGRPLYLGLVNCPDIVCLLWIDDSRAPRFSITCPGLAGVMANNCDHMRDQAAIELGESWFCGRGEGNLRARPIPTRISSPRRRTPAEPDES